MRRKDKELTRLQDIEDILLHAPVVLLGLLDGDRPYVVPLDFGYADGALYVHSAQAGRKIDLLKRNPNVFFVVYTDHTVLLGPETCTSTSRFRSVMGEGRAAFLQSLDEKKRGLDIIMSKFAPGPYAYNEARLEKTAVIRIDVESMTGKKHGF